MLGLCFKVLLGLAGGRQRPTMMGNDQQQERVEDVEGSNKKGKGGQGNGDGDKGGG